jgi:predicted mannosyl-3-phosphoglycerate phosphatase (HAD superfamily)
MMDVTGGLMRIGLWGWRSLGGLRDMNKKIEIALTLLLIVFISMTIIFMGSVASLKVDIAEQTETIEAKNLELIELDKQVAQLEFKNKQLTRSIYVKDDEIAELKGSDREYQALAWQVENFEYLLNQLLNEKDAKSEVEGY